jgi:hypothetical protein
MVSDKRPASQGFRETRHVGKREPQPSRPRARSAGRIVNVSGVRLGGVQASPSALAGGRRPDDPAKAAPDRVEDDGHPAWTRDDQDAGVGGAARLCVGRRRGGVDVKDARPFASKVPSSRYWSCEVELRTAKASAPPWLAAVAMPTVSVCVSPVARMPGAGQVIVSSARSGHTPESGVQNGLDEGEAVHGSGGPASGTPPPDDDDELDDEEPDDDPSVSGESTHAVDPPASALKTTNPNPREAAMALIIPTRIARAGPACSGWHFDWLRTPSCTGRVTPVNPTHGRGRGISPTPCSRSQMLASTLPLRRWHDGGS